MIAAVSVTEDVTKSKEMEREALQLKTREKIAIESSKLKSQFLANMSHEIRTPLNGILGMAQILFQDKSLSEEQLRFVDIIKNSGKLLLSIINDILDFSKIEAGKLDIENITFSLNEAFKLCIDLMTPLSLEKGIPIDSELSEFPKVCGDPSRFQQILGNILSNAIKFTKQGKVSIKATGQFCESRYRLEVRIKDTGIGMDTEMISRLFEPFTQKDSSTSRTYGGSGLGLSISKKLIEMMGGSIFVESEENVGTEFVCTFFFDLVKESLEFSENSTEVSKSDLSKVKILMAEDNRINQIVAIKLLEKLGFSNIVVVGNGREAVKLCKEDQFDIILMDLHMPEMDGLEAVRHIRQFNKDVPIIALTASATLQDKEECEKADMDGHISKPVSIEALKVTIDAVYNDKKNRFRKSSDLLVVK